MKTLTDRHIGLDEGFLAETSTPYYITPELVESLLKPRAKFSHKGDYGHALLVCGSATMPGAAILATGGALRSGCGLVTTHIPKDERFALIANHPSAMLSLDGEECFSALPDRLERFSAIGVGPGLGSDKKTVIALQELLEAVLALNHTTSTEDETLGSADAVGRKIRMVLDADALNIIAENADFKRLIPSDSVLTPHQGELRRLVGDWADDKEKLEKASRLAAETRSVVIVKGAHSAICTPDGRFVFNSTGTPGMAKGGSGDVLTGLITGLAARGYDAETASVIGTYNHGRAGERAAETYGEEAMNASDLAEFL
jgi:NAD(P)H-hydrate epimerase